jgi:PAS domain S-box-containing protein
MSSDDRQGVCVLHVDDEPRLAETVGRLLETHGEALSVATETDPAAALDRVGSEPIDCVVSDYDMPGMDGLELLSAVRERRPGLPFILFTGAGSEGIASEAISAGVTDYIEKGGGSDTHRMLANRVENAVDRYRAERARERSERKFRSIAEASHDLIFRHDLDGRYTYLSPAVERVTGYAAGELEGEHFGDLIVEADRPVAREAFRTVASGDPVEGLELAIRTRDGDRRTLSINARPVYEDGELVGTQGVARDVTDVDALSEELRSTRRRLRRTVERIDDGFLAVSDEWRLTHVNDEAGAVLGRDPDDLVGADVWETFPAAVGTAFESECRRAMADQEPVRFEEYYEPLGTWFEVRAYPDRTGLSVFLRDVTERRETRDRIEALHDAAVELAASETPAEVCRRTVGAATDVLSHELCSVGLREDDRLVTEAVSDGVASDEYYDGTPLDASDNLAVETYGMGESRLVEDLRDTRFAPATSDYRAAICVPLDDHGVFQAVTDTPGSFGEGDLELAELLAAHAATALDRIRRERQLRRRERDLRRQNERLEAFASVVSHDLRNPLEVARGNAELARETGDPDAFDEVDAALGRMDDLIDDVLGLARGPATVEDPSPVSLSVVVEEAWGTVDVGDATLAVEDDAVFPADPGQLRRLFENLFHNSVEHGSAGGRPGGTTVDGGTGETGGVAVRVGTTDDGFFVADDGPGIDDDVPVFEPGVSGEPDGTGLGLSIVSRIADAHGWTVSAGESAEGGARFEFGGVRD